MGFISDIKGDIRNWVVNVVMTALVSGVILILAPIGAAIVKAVKAEPVPWTALILVAAIGIVLVVVGIVLLRKKPMQGQLNRISQLLDTEIEKGGEKLAALGARPPKFRIESGPNVKDSYSINTWGTLPVRFLHPIVLIDSGTVKNCTGYLTEIRKGTQKWTVGDQLTFSSSDKPRGEITKTLHHGINIYRLDVLVITSNGDIHVCNETREWRRWPRLRDIFAEPGDYFLDIAITGDGAAAQAFTLKFNWTGNWQTSFLATAGDASSATNSTDEPLTGVRLRNECDKWIENGRSIHARLARGEQNAISDAQEWLDRLRAFTEINLSVSDFDPIHNSNTSGETFHREMAKLKPPHEVIMYERLLAYRAARLLEFRNKMK